MTTPIRETVLAAFQTQLAANVGAGWTVHRNQKDAVTAAQSVVIEDGGMDRDDSNSAEDRYTLRVKVWAYVEGIKTGATPGAEVLGAAISDAHARIVSAITRDPSLGGAADYTTEANMDDPEFDASPGTRDNAAFAVGFTVQFVTAVGNPFAAP